MVLKMKMTVGMIMIHLSIVGEIISGSEDVVDCRGDNVTFIHCRGDNQWF